jgi:uncharacterized membrane protein
MAVSSTPRRPSLRTSIARLIRAIQDDDDEAIEAVIRLSRSRRLFAPLAFGVGAFAMLFNGLRLLLTNWRLTLVQILPAMWIWVATYDLKAHALHGKSFHVLTGPVLIPIDLAIIAITAASFFLNAVFAFAIAGPPPLEVRPAFAAARSHLKPVLVSGMVVGLLLALSTTVVTRWGRPWFTLSLGIVVGLMMISYVAVPARLIGKKATYSRRDKLATSALTTALSVTVCTPPYLILRLGILMLGSSALNIVGFVLVTLGAGLQAGATGSVRAIKMSATLIGGAPPERLGDAPGGAFERADPPTAEKHSGG